MGWKDLGAAVPNPPADDTCNAVIQTTPRSSGPTSTVSLCNANFSRVSLGIIGEGAGHV